MKDTLLAPGHTRVATPDEFDQLPEHVQEAIRDKQAAGNTIKSVLHISGFDRSANMDPTGYGWTILARKESPWDSSKPEEKFMIPEWFGQ